MMNNFIKYQKDLLTLANSEAGRYLLGIKDELPIIKLTPSSSHQLIGFQGKKPLIEGMFYCGDKIASIFSPILEKQRIAMQENWKLFRKIQENPYESFLHFSGLESNHKYPQIYLATFTGSPNTGGGVTTCKNAYANTADSDWAVNHDAATGTVEVGSTNTVRLAASGTTNKWSILVKNFHSYDLAVMGAGADVSGSPTIGLYITGKTETLASQSYNIYNSNAASASDVVAGDYNDAGTTAQATALTGAGITTSAVNNWTLNATGIATLEAAAGSAVKFSVRLVSDAANAEPTWSSAVVANIGFHMSADATPPLLTATYTPVPGFMAMF